MNLEYIRNIGGYDEHAVRLSDFDSSQARLFCSAIERLITGSAEPMHLSSLDFIVPVSCELTLRISDEDLGITTEDDRQFICDLSIHAYRDMIDLLRPFCQKESKGYQWLYDLDIPIGLLFSAGKDMPVE